jgi:hypothetical protein
MRVVASHISLRQFSLLLDYTNPVETFRWNVSQWSVKFMKFAAQNKCGISMILLTVRAFCNY